MNEFERYAETEGEQSYFADYWYLIRKNKKYWLLPLIVFLVLLGVLTLLGGTAAAPFIYTLF